MYPKPTAFLAALIALGSLGGATELKSFVGSSTPNTHPIEKRQALTYDFQLITNVISDNKGTLSGRGITARAGKSSLLEAFAFGTDVATNFTLDRGKLTWKINGVKYGVDAVTEAAFLSGSAGGGKQGVFGRGYDADASLCKTQSDGHCDTVFSLCQGPSTNSFYVAYDLDTFRPACRLARLQVSLISKVPPGKKYYLQAEHYDGNKEAEGLYFTTDYFDDGSGRGLIPARKGTAQAQQFSIQDGRLRWGAGTSGVFGVIDLPPREFVTGVEDRSLDVHIITLNGYMCVMQSYEGAHSCFWQICPYLGSYRLAWFDGIKYPKLKNGTVPGEGCEGVRIKAIAA